MTKQTNLQSIQSLYQAYTPKADHVMNRADMRLVREALELKRRSNAELCDIGNTLHLLCGWLDQDSIPKEEEILHPDMADMMSDWRDNINANGRYQNEQELLDTLCLFSLVIDYEKFQRGMKA